MINVKVTCTNGNSWITDFNGTLAEAKAYFMGKVFTRELEGGEEIDDQVCRVNDTRTGLTVYVYKDASGMHDCTNGGISSKATKLTLINVPGPFHPDEDAPAATLEVSRHGVLLIREAGKSAGMFGGNFAHTSDSRFSEACERLYGQYFGGAVKIFDRYE